MGKRSNFERNERDFYPTPRSAVLPLLPFLNDNTMYCEPCAGNGALIEHLLPYHCVLATDIEPQRQDILKKDVLSYTEYDVASGTVFITNPPWDRKILHPVIEHLSAIAPTWLLFDADWMHTKQAIPYLKYCDTIIAVGRVKWIPDSKHTGKDNCCWYLFNQQKVGRVFSTSFYGR